MCECTIFVALYIATNTSRNYANNISPLEDMVLVITSLQYLTSVVIVMSLITSLQVMIFVSGLDEIITSHVHPHCIDIDLFKGENGFKDKCDIKSHIIQLYVNEEFSEIIFA